MADLNKYIEIITLNISRASTSKKIYQVGYKKENTKYQLPRRDTL